MIQTALIIPAFIAGLLTFLAPCTLPLVPGYLGFISGVSQVDLDDPKKQIVIRRKVFINGLLYVIGFSLVFILLGSLFGLGGLALAQYRVWFSRIGGIFVIFFGLYMMHVFKLPGLQFLDSEKTFIPQTLKPGAPLSSLIFGATFAFGWTPCVGPILGSILILASSSATVLQGALLLSIFSLGLGLPFLIIAATYSSAVQYVGRLSKLSQYISFIGGAFLLIIGLMLVTDSFTTWLAFFYRNINFLNSDWLLDRL